MENLTDDLADTARISTPARRVHNRATPAKSANEARLALEVILLQSEMRDRGAQIAKLGAENQKLPDEPAQVRRTLIQLKYR